MPAFLAPLLAKPAVKAAVAFIGRWWKLGVGLILGGLLIAPLAHCQGKRDGRAGLLAEQRAEALKATHEADQDEQERRGAAENRADAIEGAMENASDGNRVDAVLDELRRRGRR